MFAGAVREAVFSTPEVIRRVNADFIPVSVKASLLHQPGSDPEGRLLNAIGRSGPAPQGLSVLNSAGQVLAWSMMFDDEQAVLDFLDHSLKRFAEHPDGRQEISTERFMRFPSQKMAGMIEPAKPAAPPTKHPAGLDCPQSQRPPAGTLTVRLHGRALEADGKLSNETTRQELYVEDRFSVSVELQRRLAETLKAGGTEPVRLPDAFARLLAQHAYLGQLDVQPLQNPGGAEPESARCEFWALADAQTPGQFRLVGQTEIKIGQQQRSNDRAGFRHDIALTWEGLLEVDGGRLKRLLTTAQGTEKLQWRAPGNLQGAEVSHLPAGRAIDRAGGVRYGLSSESPPAAAR